MQKISTFFKKDINDLGRVIKEIDPNNIWVLNESIATRKFDGTSCAIINGDLYKRYDLKKGRVLPKNAIPCQDADEITGHHPHWVLCDRKNKDERYHFEAFDKLVDKVDGTYELCGEKVQNNPEKFEGHVLVKHGCEKIEIHDYSYEGIYNLLSNLDIEGIVFHHISDGRMCKIRKTDFGLKR